MLRKCAQVQRTRREARLPQGLQRHKSELSDKAVVVLRTLPEHGSYACSAAMLYASHSGTGNDETVENTALAAG